MCIDNPTNPDPNAITALQDTEIVIVVRKIFVHENWAALRRAYPGKSDLELLKMAALQSGFIAVLKENPIRFQVEEFAR